MKTLKPRILAILLTVVTLGANTFQPSFALAAMNDFVPGLNPDKIPAETIIKESEEGNMFPKVIDGIPLPDKKVRAVITAYTSTPDQTDDSPFYGATGKHVYDGMIAANWLPFGTKIKIPSVYGDKIFTVDDRMNSRYGYGRLDVWLDTTKTDARKFGVKRVEVEVYYVTKAPKELAKR